MIASRLYPPSPHHVHVAFTGVNVVFWLVILAVLVVVGVGALILSRVDS